LSKREFEDIADNVCSGIISSKQRAIARNELLDHLDCELEDAVSRDIPEDEALKEVINNFGSVSSVKAEIAESYKEDNYLAIVKGIYSFAGYILIAGALFLFEIFLLFISFDQDTYLFHCCILFIVLSVLSFIAAKKKMIKLPWAIIPNALLQLIWVYEKGPTFIIAISELLTGNLKNFLNDLHYYEILSANLSQLLMAVFIVLFVAINIAISICSFRLKAKRTVNKKPCIVLKHISAIVMAFVCLSSALCFRSVFIIDDNSGFDYTELYYIVPAESKTEIEKVLSFYKNEAENDGKGIFPGGNDIYQTKEIMYKVWYHHDLDSAVIDIHAYCNGKEKTPKNEDWDWMIDNGFDPSDPDFIPMYDLTYEDTPEVYGDKTIIQKSSYDEVPRDIFYKTATSRVVIKPDKKQGYLVAIPFTNDTFRTDNAEIIELPLKKDIRIYGNMHLNKYEIILKKSSDE
jgi:hypothetical protein